MNPPAVPGAPNPERAQLIADLAAFLAHWGKELSAGSDPRTAAYAVLSERSVDLGNRARLVGFGGVAHHLDRCRLLASTQPVDIAGLRGAMKDLAELAWQAKQELSPAERAFVDQTLARGARSPSPAPPPPLGGSFAPAPPPMLTLHDEKKPGFAAPPPPLSSPMNVARPPPFDPAPPPAPPPMAPAAMPAPPSVSAAPAPAPVAPPPPKLAVRTMFGLRAFGKQKEPQPAGATGSSSLLGLKRGFTGQQPAAAAPPPLISGLPPLPGESGPPGLAPPQAGPAPPPMNQFLDRMGKGDASKRTRDVPARQARSKAAPKGAGRHRKGEPSNIVWWVVGGLGFATFVVAIGITLAITRSKPDVDARKIGPSASAPIGNSSAAAHDTAPTANETAPSPKSVPATSDTQLGVLLTKAHSQGKESKELKAFVDAQAAMQAKLLETGKCEGSPAACSALFKAREELDQRKNIGERKSSASSGGFRSKWLAGLKMPASFPVEDNDKVRNYFQKYTDTLEGRARFESMLFRCGAYQDSIKATLIKYELPSSLLAVVFAESGCDPKARSPVGAEGLWQFMPEAARAYHLHIVEDVVDERHSPPKSTEAAIHFLADLYAKFRSWDLVFAAYNMGPYGLISRMQVAGTENIGFWDLMDADLLPSETSEYVPIIEAFALILENLQRLKFTATQMRAPEVTEDLEAPGGTRLSLVAEAAATSVNQLRLLNQDLDEKVDIVPKIGGATFAIQVSKDVVWQAREKLQALLAQSSRDDTCVPPSFDWGKQRFTQEMEEECRKKQALSKP